MATRAKKLKKRARTLMGATNAPATFLEAAEEFRRVMRHDPSAFDAAERLAALS